MSKLQQNDLPNFPGMPNDITIIIATFIPHKRVKIRPHTQRCSSCSACSCAICFLVTMSGNYLQFNTKREENYANMHF